MCCQTSAISQLTADSTELKSFKTGIIGSQGLAMGRSAICWLDGWMNGRFEDWLDRYKRCFLCHKKTASVSLGSSSLAIPIVEIYDWLSLCRRVFLALVEMAVNTRHSHYQYYIQVNNQLYTPATFHQGKEPLVFGSGVFSVLVLNMADTLSADRAVVIQCISIIVPSYHSSYDVMCTSILT